MPEPRLLTYAQVQAELGLGRNTVRRLVADGRLISRRFGYRTVRITRDSVERFLALQSAKAPGGLRVHGESAGRRMAV